MSQLKVSSIVDTAGGNTVTINGATPTQYNTMGRNRIINGDMRIDQRNAGASVTPSADQTYTLDRWMVRNAGGAGRFSVVQSSTSAANFPISVLLTNTTTAVPSGSEFYSLQQAVEGYNMSDFGWGTADAKSVTISFKVRSSLTGTYCVSVRNSSGARSFVSEYSISAANTFETKTVTIPGETSGTWNSTNGLGLFLDFCLGAASGREGTAGSWQSSNIVATTNQVDWINTASATFYITGVQLEVGSVATEFERRPYGTELALCQRYYETSYPAGVAPGTAGQNTLNWGVGSNTYAGGVSTAAQSLGPLTFKVVKRATPTLRIWSYYGVANTASHGYTGSDLASGSATVTAQGTYGFGIFNNSGSNASTGFYSVIANFDASAEL